MSNKCQGCGVTLQYDDKDALGYSAKKEALYCQRCFRMMHYDDVKINMQKAIANDEILSKVNALKALVVWVVDLFDFEGCMIEGINRHLSDADILLVATKRDLLPQSVGNQKLVNFINAQLKKRGIKVNGIVLAADLNTYQRSLNNGSISVIQDSINQLRAGRNVAVLGCANAGKSTLLNAIINNQRFSVSYHPGTSLDLNPIVFEDYIMYDTPGLVRSDSLLTHAPQAILKVIIPFKPIKPQVYQLNSDQSLAIAGLARLDIMGCDKVSVTTYFANNLNIHRCKQSNADKLWSEHLGELLCPCTVDNFKKLSKYQTKPHYPKTDVVINGLGWFSISGSFKELTVYTDKNCGVTFREAII